MSASLDPGSGEEELEDTETTPPARSTSSSSQFLSCLDVISSLADKETQLLLTLMQACNLEGYTPFMSAVVLKVSQWVEYNTCLLTPH